VDFTVSMDPAHVGLFQFEAPRGVGIDEAGREPLEGSL
jgi:hypothetical protein